MRRSRTLRDQQSAYGCMRKVGVSFTSSRVAPQVDFTSCPSSYHNWDRFFYITRAVLRGCFCNINALRADDAQFAIRKLLLRSLLTREDCASAIFHPKLPHLLVPHTYKTFFIRKETKLCQRKKSLTKSTEKKARCQKFGITFVLT